MLLEKLDGLADDIAAAARARRRSARLHAHDARVAGCDKVLDPQFLAMELHRLERVDHRRRETLGQRKG